MAIDGKAVCKNLEVRKTSMKNRLYIVSGWAVPNGICLGQKKVDCKSNEITAIPELINELDIEGCIATIVLLQYRLTPRSGKPPQYGIYDNLFHRRHIRHISGWYRMANDGMERCRCDWNTSHHNLIIDNRSRQKK